MTPSPLRILLLSVLPIVVMALAINVLLNKLDTAQAERDQAQYELEGLREAARITGERLATAAANDLKHTQELTDALNTNQELRRAVDVGTQRLLVKATCSSAAVPANSSAGGLAAAGTAELTADARSAYYTLRDQLALSRQMILGLQDHVRSFCTTTPTPTGAPHD
ncbi:Bacteriophage lysis protein [compost metagenome]